MFKYISEILAQFTAPQRVLALLLVLLSIVIITLGPSFIDSITLNQEEFQSEIDKQKKLNAQFKNEIDTLTLQIIRNQKKCTDDIIARELEIMEEIENLKRRIANTPMVESRELRIVSPSDSVAPSAPVRIVDPRPKMMMDGLNVIQRKIKTDVDEMRGGN